MVCTGHMVLLVGSSEVPSKVLLLQIACGQQINTQG